MKYSLQKYLNAGYSPLDAQRELSAIQELNVGHRPQVVGHRYGSS